MDTQLAAKYDHLKVFLSRVPSLAVGFWGGVDRSLVLAAAVEVLSDRVGALTAIAPCTRHRRFGTPSPSAGGSRCATD